MKQVNTSHPYLLIFIRQKPDGSYRLILNLKNLNEDMPYIQFKMETIQSVLSLITPRCYLASLDLKDAYYSALFTQITLVYVVSQENLQN